MFILLYNLSNKVFVIFSDNVKGDSFNFPMLLSVCQFSRISVINICANPIAKYRDKYFSVNFVNCSRNNFFPYSESLCFANSLTVFVIYSVKYPISVGIPIKLISFTISGYIVTLFVSYSQ